MAYASGAPRDPTDVVGRRIVAYAIDVLLVLIATVVVLSLVRHDTFGRAPGDVCEILRARAADSSVSSSVLCVHVGSRAWLWNRGEFLTAIDVAALIGVLNLVVLQAVTGASIGKHALGLHVIDGQGRTAGFGRTIVRWLLLIVDGGVFLIGLITVLVTHPHRRLGDFAGGTYVVAKEPEAVAARSLLPYGGSTFAAPTTPSAAASPSGVLPPSPPTVPPGWGVQSSAPVPSAPMPSAPLPPADSPWTTPPSAPPVRPTVPPAAPVARPAPAPAPAPSVARPAPAPAPKLPRPDPKPESWWDTAIPDDPPDGEQQP